MTPELWAQIGAIGAAVLTTIAVRFVIPLLRRQKPPSAGRPAPPRARRRNTEEGQ